MSYEELRFRLLDRDPEPELRASRPYDILMAAEIESLGSPEIVKIGLHALNDDLPRAHTLAQSLEGEASADYWHAIVHRREGDYSNAKYWLRRVGAHPVLAAMHGDIEGAARFVDMCRNADGSDQELRKKQKQEMASLLEFAAREA